MRPNNEHPYSPALERAGIAAVSGAVAVDSHGVPVAGRHEALDAAVERGIENLAAIGRTLDDVVKITYYVTDITLRAEANTQFSRLFSEPRPARTFIGVNELPYGASVELDLMVSAESLPEPQTIPPEQRSKR